MNDTPILFTPENVRAIFDGRKTQTRRIVKLPKDRGTWEQSLFEGSQCVDSKGRPGRDMVCISNTTTGKTIASPYGQPGDRLWVRETWANPGEEGVLYRANPEDAALVERWKTDPNHPQVKWTPSTYMPKAFCRLWLELTEVRVERLQEISQADALAEGAPPSHPSIDVVSREFGYPDFSRSWYAQLWERINGEGSWALNPFVWVIEYKRVPLG